MSEERVVLRVKDLDSLAVFHWYEILGEDPGANNQLRRIVKTRANTDKPKFICDSCGHKVYIRACSLGNGAHGYTFVHFSKDHPCIWQNKKSLSKKEVLIQAYNGKKESERHIEAKASIKQWLEKDGRFSETYTEKVKKGTGYSRYWRKPDVTTLYYGQPIFFEVQVSPTFDEVIFAREAFYQKERGPLFWIFYDFEPENARQMEKDCYYHNKGNVFSIDAESKAATLNSGRLTLTLHWIKSVYDQTTETLSEEWHKELIDIGDLLFDIETCKPFRYDAFRVKKNASEQMASHQAFLKKEKTRHAFEELVINSEYEVPDSNELSEFYKEFNIDPSLRIFDDERKRILAMLSARDGVNYFRANRREYKWLTNLVINHYNDQWSAFVDIARAYKNEQKFIQVDNKKLADFRKNGVEKFPQDESLYPIYAVIAANALYIQKRLKNTQLA